VGIFARLFGAKADIRAKQVEHAVIVSFGHGGSTDLEPLFALERELEAAIASAACLPTPRWSERVNDKVPSSNAGVRAIQLDPYATERERHAVSAHHQP
jgi:hypothetical protein